MAAVSLIGAFSDDCRLQTIMEFFRMNPRTSPKRSPRLIAEIALVIALKLCIIFCLWWLFFSPEHRTSVTPDKMGDAIFSSSAAHQEAAAPGH